MNWKLECRFKANPNCEACNGEGVCSYAMGEDDYDDVCDVCFPNGLPDFESEEYDKWRDDHMEFEKK